MSKIVHGALYCAVVLVCIAVFLGCAGVFPAGNYHGKLVPKTTTTTKAGVR